MTVKMNCRVGEPLPAEAGDLPEHADGSPMHIPVFFDVWPLHVVLPADVSTAHEQAIMAADPATASVGGVYRLWCLQPNQITVLDAEGGGVLPLVQFSLYLRGGAGPIHRPLHWIGVPCLPPPPGSAAGFVQEGFRAKEAALADAPTMGMPCTVMVTGRERRLLLVSHTVMHNVAAVTWTRALRAAAGSRSTWRREHLPWVFDEAIKRVERRGCVSRLVDPVSVCGHSRTVQGKRLQRWLLKRGWLHQQQVATDAASAGGDAR